MNPRPRATRVVAVGSIITVAFMGSVIVTPLYSLWQRKFGFSDVTLTLIYASYVIGNVGALLFSGQISDQIGRRRIALPALGVAAASAVLFLFAENTAWLFAGRLLIGLAAGTLSGTGTAWLAETFGPGEAPTATVTAATANMIGIAVGPLVAGLLAEYASRPLRLPLLAYLAMLLVVAVAVWRTADHRRPRVQRFRELRVRPRIGVPADRVRQFAAPAVTGFATFSLAGLYFALIPSIVLGDLHESNLAVGGLVVCELGVIAVALIVLGRRLQPLTAMTAGLVCLVPAMGLIVGSEAAGSLPLLLVATAFGAVPLALGYRGSLQIVNEIAPDERRGEVVSTYFLACFLGNAVPVIGVGVLTQLSDRLVASAVFACVVAAMALAALASSRAVLR